ncbi:Retrovirus-related Pol polyprotein from transposon 412 [Araneus ventricosus]|uniref:RNA-directed DNA polymerase n=1 Tax=Araneus ventricosus TaxID=182803 RepID=A0A4Y2K1V9_ARAVE|nr:Retrovirus-related Pol polyprotein from transposon 412 [Araneus ventricosus]
MSLAYAECPQDVRDSLAAQYFVDAIRDEDTQHATRLMDAKDLKSALAYSMKYEAAKTVSKTSRNCGGRNGLYLEGSICGISCLMLVDTGANVTLVRTDLVQKLKENFIYTAPNISLKTATGEKAEIRGKLDAAIECVCRKFQHRIYVADITDPYILGLDFLQKFNFTVDLEKNEIRTGGEEIPLFSASAEHSKLCSVLAKEKTIKPTRSECLIQGVPEVSGKFRYAVTDFPSQVSQKGVLVAATLVDLKREAIPVRVLNLDNKPKTVDKGAVIATCEPVVDIVARPQEFSESLRLPLILENLEGLNEEQRTAVKELLQEFQNLFSTNDSDVGRCNMTQHRINTGNHPPIKQYPRCLPLAKKEEAERLVKEMVDNGIIEESSGPWASPIVLVKKKDGSIRFCVDYRKLNEITIKDSYPLPRIDDTLDALKGSQWFSTLDLKSGYWQVEIQPEDKEKTAFTTGQGLWQFKPILEKKLNSEDRPSWQEIAPESPATKRYWAVWDSLHLKDGVLYRKWESDDESFCRWQLILPKSRIQELLRETLDSVSGGHFGVMKTLSKTRERFYWDRLRADVEKWCRECHACGARKGPKQELKAVYSAIMWAHLSKEWL